MQFLKMSRCIVLRNSLKEHNMKAFKYPFFWIKTEDYNLHKIVKPLITQSKEDALNLSGNFPKSIDQWLWSRPGKNDEDAWLLLCILKSGAYAFYRAGCDYTGFDCQGGMELIVSRNFAEVIEYGMNDYEYEIYMEETQ